MLRAVRVVGGVARACLVSTSTTLYPARRKHMAMPLPMSPAPMMPTFSTPSLSAIVGARSARSDATGTSGVAGA